MRLISLLPKLYSLLFEDPISCQNHGREKKISRMKILSCTQRRTQNSSAELAIALEDLVEKCVRRSYSFCAGISPMLSPSRCQKWTFLSRKGSKSSVTRDIMFVEPASDFNSSIVLSPFAG